MANIKISQLTAAASTVGTQEFEVNESGTSKKVTGSQIKTFVKDGLVISDITSVTATAAELNYISGVTSAIQTQLNAKAALASPALTGTPTAPTATAADSTTQIATTAFVTTADNLKANLASPALTGTPTAPTAAVGTNTTQVATTAFVSANLGVTENENRIINGAFDFWQRGTSSTSNGLVAADRWINSIVGGTVTQSRQAFTVGDTLGSNNPTYFLRQAVSGQTLTSQFGATQQRIEGVRSYAGQTITFLGWARRSSGTGNMVVEGAQVFGTGGSPSASITAISPTTVTLTGSFAPFAAVITVPSITGKTLGTNANDYFSVTIWASAGSDFNARTNSLGLQTIGVDLWGVHIKVGTHTTAATDLYKQPEMGPELARCQRYYQSFGGNATYERIASGNVFSTTQAYIVVMPKVTMRSAPTLSSVSQLAVQNASGASVNATVAAETLTVNSFNVTATVASGLVAGNATHLFANNSIAARLNFDAEL